MRQLLRSLSAKLWELVDSDSVRPFIWFYYIPLLAAGIYATVWLPRSLVDEVLGHAYSNLWAWIQIPATLSAMIGLALRHGDAPVDEMGPLTLFRDWLGLWMQLGGHACMCQVLLAFEIVVFSLIGGPYWWLVWFGGFAITSYVTGTAILTLQCVRKLSRATRLKQQGGTWTR